MSLRAAEVLLDNHFVSVRTMPDAMRQVLRLVAQTKPARPVMQYYRPELTQTKCYWSEFWWARLVRRMCRNRWLHKLVPYPLEALAYAQEVVIQPKVFTLPDEITDKIHAQLCGLLADGKDPQLIIAGRQSWHDLIICRHVSTMPPMMGDDFGDDHLEYHGVKVVLTAKIEPNAVIVI